MKRILLILLSIVLFTAAIGLIQGCSDNPTEPVNTSAITDCDDGSGVSPPEEGKNDVATMALAADTWPTSMWGFKFPFRGVYNNYYTGEVWKITCGYYCYKHVNEYYPGAAKHSIDLQRVDAASPGSYVLAPARGIVVFSGEMSGYGWCVVMDHDAGHTGQGYKSIVAHLLYDPRVHVRVGDDLLQGTVLGKCGASGGDWPAHIHFSVWKNNRTNDLNGISGGPSLIEYGKYCSGNALVPPPRGW